MGQTGDKGVDWLLPLQFSSVIAHVSLVSATVLLKPWISQTRSSKVVILTEERPCAQ